MRKAKTGSSQNNRNLIPQIQEITNFEYFDERFYKVIFAKLSPDKLSHINPNFIIQTKSHTEIYFPSVTTIKGGAAPTPKAIIELISREGLSGSERKKMVAAERGVRIHAATVEYDSGKAIIFQMADIKNKAIKKLIGKREKIYLTQEEMIALSRYDMLFKVLKPVIVESEFKVFNFEDSYAGTLDRVFQLGGFFQISNNLNTKPELQLPAGKYVIDFKTGYASSNDLMQTAAYLKAYENLTGCSDMIGCIIIALNADIKKGIEGVKLYVATTTTEKNIDYYYNRFLNLNRVWKDYSIEENIKPKSMEIPQVIIREKAAAKRRKK